MKREERGEKHKQRVGDRGPGTEGRSKTSMVREAEGGQRKQARYGCRANNKEIKREGRITVSF